MSRELLTAVIPTRNRPHNLSGQLRLFEASGVTRAIVVADSSDSELAPDVRAAVGTRADWQAYPATGGVFDKLAQVIDTITTPFVALASDRKITFPHALDAALAYLMEHDDYVAAQGYVVGFSRRNNDLDINRVIYFTPTLAAGDPLQRHYDLMRRYQSWQFSVFRVEPLAAAVGLAKSVAGKVFQEVVFMNALALQGKMARLPQVISLQTTETSFYPPRRNDPFYWFLDDPRSFFRHYVAYRRRLARFITERNLGTPRGADLEQLLDTIHAVWLHYNFDGGVLNYAAQLRLGHPLPPLPDPRQSIPWRAIASDDVVHAARGARRYIWRREVVHAEPRGEIDISSGEIRRVERQLDVYFR